MDSKELYHTRFAVGTQYYIRYYHIAATHKGSLQSYSYNTRRTAGIEVKAEMSFPSLIRFLSLLAVRRLFELRSSIQTTTPQHYMIYLVPADIVSSDLKSDK